jgi:hypothetical protein
MKILTKLRSNAGMIIVISLLFLTGMVSWLLDSGLRQQLPEKERNVIYDHTYEDLTLNVLEWNLTTDPDTGKVIVKMPVEITNKSDHAFTFNMPHFSYNDSEYVFTLFNVEDDGIEGKISRSQSAEGTITITLETREPSDVKTLNPTFSIYDMKSEKEIELTPELKKP